MAQINLEKIEILNLIDEQRYISFSGRINILYKSNTQLVGTILLKDGAIHYVKYKTFFGRRALVSVVMEELFAQSIKYILEPEMIDSVNKNIFVEFDFIKFYIIQIIEETQKSLQLRPPPQIHLKIDSNFVAEGSEISPLEYDILCLISGISNVGQLYQNQAVVQDFEITNSLVRLRNKKALLVIEGP